MSFHYFWEADLDNNLSTRNIALIYIIYQFHYSFDQKELEQTWLLLCGVFFFRTFCLQCSYYVICWSKEIIFIRIEKNNITWSNVFKQNWMSISLSTSYQKTICKCKYLFMLLIFISSETIIKQPHERSLNILIYDWHKTVQYNSKCCSFFQRLQQAVRNNYRA